MTDPSPVPTSVQAELAAMRKVAAALEPLDDSACDRIVLWAYDRYRSSMEAVVDYGGRTTLPGCPTGGDQ